MKTGIEAYHLSILDYYKSSLPNFSFLRRRILWESSKSWKGSNRSFPESCLSNSGDKIYKEIPNSTFQMSRSLKISVLAGRRRNLLIDFLKKFRQLSDGGFKILIWDLFP